MKRIASTDSLGAFISMCPNTEEGNCHVYGRDFQTMFEGLDEEGCVEESGQMGEKKRRLSVEQVKALEKNFEVENKLEPDRKVKLAHELGLQPRQVAVWFQNRRARWKTKQLERDYGVLKANYDALKLDFERLQHDNEALHKEIRELKSKLNEEDNNQSNVSVKEEAMVLDNDDDDDKLIKQSKTPVPGTPNFAGDDEELIYESFNSTNNGESLTMGASIFFSDLKDGSSDSDSSAILNEDNNNNNNNNSSSSNSSAAGGGLQSHRFVSPAANCFESAAAAAAAAGYQPQFVKIEEHNFFGGDETCNFFSDDQAPALPWYCQEPWN